VGRINNRHTFEGEEVETDRRGGPAGNKRGQLAGKMLTFHQRGGTLWGLITKGETEKSGGYRLQRAQPNNKKKTTCQGTREKGGKLMKKKVQGKMSRKRKTGENQLHEPQKGEKNKRRIKRKKASKRAGLGKKSSEGGSEGRMSNGWGGALQ